MNKLSFWKRPQAVLLAVALASGIGGIGFAAGHLGMIHPAFELKLANPNEGPSTGFAPVVRKVLPAVVSVSSTKISKIPTEFGGGQLPDDPLFRQFFGNSAPQFNAPRQAPEQREYGLGSGVIMTPDGYILTNNHVVDGATQVQVRLADKREFPAKIVGTDAKSDLAVLKIDASDLPCITVGDSSKVQVGDYALAIGNPFGVGETVTMGIVSATHRSNLGIEQYENFIQTDAPINPGNSGGALVNDRGELIGINTAIIAHGSEGNQGIGFAIPVDMARNVMEQLVKSGKVTRAYLGILPQDVTPAMAKAFGVTQDRGALVGDVSPNSPAQRSGLERGDVILEVNGKPVTGSNDLRMTISMMQPSSEVNLRVERNGAERNVTVQLGELPTEIASVKPQGQKSEGSLSGVAVENLTPESAHDLGLPANTQGVVVTNVDPASQAAGAGLRQGDVIQQVNRKPVHNTSDFEQALNSSKEDNLLLVNRGGNTLFVAV
ncbi:MAG TPA: DegQ family serine endoprotease [Bryobacteraceae bacterium]|nr:DegQ family serine endoprotease [Bryobacteraceae bacterium]HUO29331.1 DegQ family serine endoprotease [Bryobacteraceae bacterium]